MGPRLFRRGNMVLLGAPARYLRASMGPRLFRRGNNTCAKPVRKAALLQWGHVFSDVEIRGTPCRFLQQRFASMGPRLFRRGNYFGPTLWHIMTRWLQWGHVFSDVEIGNSAWPMIRRRMLQWGHVFSDVEMVLLDPGTYPSATLQWGHVFSDVEIWSFMTVLRGLSAASMGPRLFRRGNLVALVI